MTIVCVDAGGTFTDFVLLSKDGVSTFKVRSTPENPAQAVLNGLSRVHPPFELRHGTTVATNAILEGKFARTAFITNEGFRDLLFLARQTRPDLYSLEPRTPSPPVSRDDCFELPGRLRPDASELCSLRLDMLPALDSYDSVAICLLYSYANASHERAAANHLTSNSFVSISSDVSPEFREYERASTTVLNAAIGPRVATYTRELAEKSAAQRLSVMSSSGGLIDARDVLQLPIRTVTSGPAAGVVAATRLGKSLGYERLIAFDMGGTSTDVTLIDAAPALASQSEIAGLPIRQHRVDVHTVGCGGGSIAWLDEAGALQVGPASAGSEPGPALYGSGMQFTVTDANYLLGRIDADSLAGGNIRVVKNAPAKAGASLAASLGCTLAQLADAVVERAESSMSAAIREVSSARGFDPADFSLLAFGGAGGQHACALAESLGISTVIVPAGAGVFAAMGLALAPRVWEEWRSVVGYQADWEDTYEDLKHRAVGKLGEPPTSIVRTADLRYKGQSHEITVTASGSRADAEVLFANEHRHRFEVHFSGVDIEWVCARVRVEAASGADYPKIETPNFGSLTGPQLLSFPDSTTYVKDGWHAEGNECGAIVMTRKIS